ncbi:hypothetical protein BN977_00818 [Mycolicibacterium cosmeticum]|uniref:Uncharacterized protein n=1 Tax=Mycolicibacterium cosmeticum TaxID=258533 RepID=W9AK01_MYCCO|nr:hypothetical protein BN977_00818 [Mycolicibacterium cosmeticum]
MLATPLAAPAGGITTGCAAAPVNGAANPPPPCPPAGGAAAACCTMPTQGTPGLALNAGCASADALSASAGEHNAAVATMLTASRFDLLRMFSPCAY